MCYHPTMRPYVVAILLLAIAGPVAAADPLAEARRLYNLGQYETAERLAREAPRSRPAPTPRASSSVEFSSSDFVSPPISAI